MSEELKPCPFCGGRAAVLNREGEDYWVQCLFRNGDEAFKALLNKKKNGVLWPIGGCLASACHSDTEADAIAAWNRRAE